MSTRGRDAPDGFEEFYAGSYQHLVGVVGSVCRDQADAEEAVQEAFVRLLGQWPKVRRYDSPEAWVRRVALGYISKRNRKVRNGRRVFARLGPPPDVPGPTGDSIDLERAFAALPQAQREVLVLQQVGLGVEAIAAELGVPTGTVKSRLSRARAALAPLLREDADHAAT